MTERGDAMSDLRRKIHDAHAAKALGDGRYKFLLSTGRVDRDGDTINPKGWRLDEYRKNPVVLFAHRHDVPAIGKSVEIGVEHDGLVGVMQFPPAGVYPLADEVHGLVDSGILMTTSVGFRPIRA